MRKRGRRTEEGKKERIRTLEKEKEKKRTNADNKKNEDKNKRKKKRKKSKEKGFVAAPRAPVSRGADTKKGD